MARRRRRISIAIVMSASLFAGLAFADSTSATTPEDTIVDTSVAAVSDTAADTSATTTPGIAEVEVLPPDESSAGVTRAEWTARAWQWWLSLPNDVNPSVTGQGCGYGQAGPVFFLPIPGELTQYECVVPEGAAIYVTAVYAECSTTERPPGFGRNEDELVACTHAILDDVGITSQVSINGQDVGDLEAYRLASPAFPLTLSEGNLNLAEPGVALAVAESSNFIIAPPSPGEYEIAISYSSADGRWGVTYTVSVEAPQVLEAPPTT
jgi:hypothetical protein